MYVRSSEDDLFSVFECDLESDPRVAEARSTHGREALECTICKSSFPTSIVGDYIPENIEFHCKTCVLAWPGVLPDDCLAWEFSTLPGSIVWVPDVEDWHENTPWTPAKVLDYSNHRIGQEYALLPIIRFRTIHPTIFYRSAERFRWFPRRIEVSKFGVVRLPRTYDPGAEQDETLDADITRICELAVPQIVALLISTNPSHGVVYILVSQSE
ncbi:hypothetical protein MKEN_00939800 [Mycena kentingensis (nom. inval.)]|nr:hypothetical protein MKEN_00939800 [Mycena kentingensis (nom. inval.)]